MQQLLLHEGLSLPQLQVDVLERDLLTGGPAEPRSLPLPSLLPSPDSSYYCTYAHRCASCRHVAVHATLRVPAP